MPRNGAQILSDFLPSMILKIGCEKCGRHGRYHVGRLRERYGDLALTEFLDQVTSDCPARQAQSVYDRCGARFLNVEEGRRA